MGVYTSVPEKRKSILVTKEGEVFVEDKVTRERTPITIDRRIALLVYAAACAGSVEQDDRIEDMLIEIEKSNG